jgi:hypothetical protein
MEPKVELRIIEVTESQEQVGAYAMLLGEVNGNRKLPVIIGSSEAQATVISLTRAKTPRPLTHDLFATALQAMGAKLMRVLIYRVADGVFYSYIYIRHGEEIIRIDSRTSDAVALAVRLKAPVLIYESILDQECIKVAVDLGFPDVESVPHKPKPSIEELQKKMEKAVAEENYELAASLRDEIRTLRVKSKE